MKIKDKLVEGEIKEIIPNIFAVIIKNTYDRAMLFCRYQEFYESPFDEIRGNSFTLEEYMRLYSQNNKKGYFSYPNDWLGFNLPSKILKDAHKQFKKHGSGYDIVMSQIIEYCEIESRKHNNDLPNPWYVIGVDDPSSPTINHEIAHGLYYINLKYKVEMDYLITQIKQKEYIHFGKQLILRGYVNDKKIIDDEIQAFMCTGKFIKWSQKKYDFYSPKFIEVFKRYCKK